MDHLYFSAKIDEERSLCLSVLSDRLAEYVDDEEFDAGSYYLYELTGQESVRSIEILARIPSSDAAFRISSIMGLK